jgi:hypothetical protein
MIWKGTRVEVPQMDIRAPTRGNRRLEALLAAANADPRLHAWWYMQQVHAERRDMSDHSWVHVQIVVNIALRLFPLLRRAGVEPTMIAEHDMGARDAEVVMPRRGRRAAHHESAAPASRSTSRSWRGSTPSTKSGSCRCSGSERCPCGGRRGQLAAAGSIRFVSAVGLSVSASRSAIGM